MEWIDYFQKKPSALDEAAFVRKETHISIVLVGSNRVFKFKKPVRLDFIDQQSLQTRYELCRAECNLNSRISPQVYLGMGFVRATEDGFRLDVKSIHSDAASRSPDSETSTELNNCLDVCVVMHHLADEYRLEGQLPSLTFANMSALAEKIFAFHRKQHIEPPSPGFRKRQTDVLETIHGVAGGSDQLEKMARGIRENLRGAYRLASRRFQELDGHGDLRLDHIYAAPDSIDIIDCVEFSKSIRQVDPYEDLAFTTMGLELEGRSELARWLSVDYLYRSGDVTGFALLPYYEIYRASVRLMVDLLQRKDSPTARLDKRIASYEQYISQKINAPAAPGTGDRWQRTGPLCIVLMGLPATGKSRIGGLLRQDGIPVISSDALRKQQNRNPGIRQPEEYGQGKYKESKKKRVYQLLVASASRLLRTENVICLDASFSRAEYRTLLEDLRRPKRALPANPQTYSEAPHGRDATENDRWLQNRRSLRFLFLETVCSREEIKRRLDRRKTKPGFSDLTDFATWEKLEAAFETIQIDASDAYVRLPTDGPKREESIFEELRSLAGGFL
ncbi:MAG: AAA family ATPase [Leptospiraceae bacterium]|nr:AAA family ATPase [Leptospiraceae bacterium]